MITLADLREQHAHYVAQAEACTARGDAEGLEAAKRCVAYFAAEIALHQEAEHAAAIEREFPTQAPGLEGIREGIRLNPRS